VDLLQLLGLLLVLLLLLLRLRRIGLLPRQLLMFAVLLLLELLPILILFRDYLILLLLIFLVLLRVPGGRSSGALDGRQVLGMRRSAGPGRCSYWRRAVVRGKSLLRIIAGRPRMLSLSGSSRSMAAFERSPLPEP